MVYPNINYNPQSFKPRYPDVIYNPVLPAARLLQKWRNAKARNSTLALKDLESLGADYDTDDCKDALQNYRDIDPSDYSDREEYQEERDGAWDTFIECLETLSGEEEENRPSYSRESKEPEEIETNAGKTTLRSHKCLPDNILIRSSIEISERDIRGSSYLYADGCDKPKSKWMSMQIDGYIYWSTLAARESGYGENIAKVTDIVINERYRGHGYSKLLVNEALANMQKVGIEGLVGVDTSGFDLWDKLGYPSKEKRAGQAIADALDVIYNGPQYDLNDRFAFHTFTDKSTEGTFGAITLDEARVNLEEVRKKLKPSMLKDHQPLFEVINSLKSQVAAAAQAIYDAWEQDEEGVDEELGCGGICDKVAYAIANIFSMKGYEIAEGGQAGDDHAYTIVHDNKKAYAVDIYPGVYETGGGYCWTKRSGVTIQPSDVSVIEIRIEDVVEQPSLLKESEPDPEIERNLRSFYDTCIKMDICDPGESYEEFKRDFRLSYWESLIKGESVLRGDEDDASYLKETELSEEEFNRLSVELSKLQRGAPEQAMRKIQMSQIAQLYGFVAEHAGDLIHRMSQAPEYFHGYYDGVNEKVKKLLPVLTEPYGFEREFKEQIKSNVEFDPKYYKDYATYDKALVELQRLGKIYADEHRKLPAINDAQKTAQRIAIAVGEFRFQDAIKDLHKLEKVLDQGVPAWQEYATSRVRVE